MAKLSLAYDAEAAQAAAPITGGPSSSGPKKRSTKIRDERLKLFANFLNIIAAGALIAALVTEPLAWSSNHQMAASYQIAAEILSIIVCLIAHGCVQAALGKLAP